MILALDPAFRNTGWCVLELLKDGPRAVAAGVITTKKADKKLKQFAGDNNHQCAQKIAKALAAIVDEYKIELACAEAQAGSKSSRAAQLMGMGWGVISTVAALKGDIPVLQARPKEVKIAVTGKGTASKTDIKNAVQLKHPEIIHLVKPITPPSLHEHVYDALAVAIACLGSTEVKILCRAARVDWNWDNV